MKKEELEKYIGELSPELQEKARQCKDMGELNALLAENDAELSEDALEAVAGGCTSSEEPYHRWIDEAYLNVNQDPNVQFRGGMLIRVTMNKDNRGGIEYRCRTTQNNYISFEITQEEYMSIISMPGMVKTKLLS